GDPKAATEATNLLFERLIAKGLRARLAPDNLLIGSRIVDLEFIENPTPAQLGQTQPYPEFPTAPGSGLGEIARSASAFLDQLAALPLGELIGGMREMVQHADTVVGSPELKRSVKQLDRPLPDAGPLARDRRWHAGAIGGHGRQHGRLGPGQPAGRARSSGARAAPRRQRDRLFRGGALGRAARRYGAAGIGR